MTTAADDSAVQEAFEAYLRGRRSVPAGDGTSGVDGLVAFADAVRASATVPGRPSLALADLLATGLLPDQSSPSAATARTAGPPSRAVRSRRRRIRVFASALFTKIASAGLAAKAATVAGIAVVGVSTAGFTGDLPTPAQHTFATLVDHATPFTAPDSTSTSGTSTGEQATPLTTTPTATPTDGAERAPAESGRATQTPAHPSNFGKTVSDAAHSTGGVDGRQVSEWAQEKNNQRKGTAGTPSASPSDPTSAPEATQASTEDRSGSGSSHASGHGDH
jgi:hypothetical protein